MVTLRWEATKCNQSCIFFSPICNKVPFLKKTVANCSSNISANSEARTLLLFKKALSILSFATDAHFIALLSLVLFYSFSFFLRGNVTASNQEFLPIAATLSASKICYEHKSEKNLSFCNCLLYSFERTLC